MLENILIFFVFLCPLVFFHELGHFAFCKIFGVRVEVFSIGFGPKILKFKMGATQYAISLIPLGGYVKMFGDDPTSKDQISEEDRKHSFTHSGKWARAWIVLGGPLANFVLAYFIFVGLLLTGEKLPEIKFGAITENSQFYQYGLRSGEVLKKVNGKVIFSPTDIVLGEESIVETVTVQGIDAQEKQVKVNTTAKDFFERFSTVSPYLRLPIVRDENGNRYALSTDQATVDWDFSLEQMADLRDGRKLYIYKIDNNNKVLSKIRSFIPGGYTSQRNFALLLKSKGYWSEDLVVKSVNMGSPADKSGLIGGDIIISIAGEEILSFDSLRSTLQASKDGKVKISILRKGKLHTFKILPELKEISGKKIKLIGVYSGGSFTKIKYINTESKGIGTAFIMGFSRTWETLDKMFTGFKKLITNEVSLKNIGGPLAIGKVASDSFHTSLSYFFQIMALISVNLGLINLFPIPVLDGGHLMFILLEIVNRGSISRRKMEIAQQVGLSLLLLLMFAALFNDFVRFF